MVQNGNSGKRRNCSKNTVGKGKIPHYEQFLLFPVFSKDFFNSYVKTRACLGKGLTLHLTVYHSIPTFNDLRNKAFRKHSGKRRKCWYPAFSQCFYPLYKESLFLSYIYFVVCKCFEFGPV